MSFQLFARSGHGGSRGGSHTSHTTVVHHHYYHHTYGSSYGSNGYGAPWWVSLLVFLAVLAVVVGIVWYVRTRARHP